MGGRREHTQHPPALASTASGSASSQPGTGGRFQRRAPSPIQHAHASTSAALAGARRMSTSPHSASFSLTAHMSSHLGSALGESSSAPNLLNRPGARGKVVALPTTALPESLRNAAVPIEEEGSGDFDEDFEYEQAEYLRHHSRSAQGPFAEASRSAIDESTLALEAAEPSGTGPGGSAAVLMRQSSDPLEAAGPSGRPPRSEPGGRLTVVCLADSLDRKGIETVLLKHEPGCKTQTWPDVLSARLPFGELASRMGEAFFFDYGCVVFWGLSAAQEGSVLATLTKHCPGMEPLAASEQQVDRLAVRYSSHSPPHIANDTITINRRQAADPEVKLAISHALAQCSKLSLYEDRITSLIDQVRHLPKEMAEKGTVSMSRQQVAQVMGEVFIQKSAVNLLSTALGTPEFFWRAPDSLQALYERVCEYLELEERTILLNGRFETLQKMLDIWRDHANHQHIARLDAIIILLIVVEVLMAGAEVIGFVLHSRL